MRKFLRVSFACLSIIFVANASFTTAYGANTSKKKAAPSASAPVVDDVLAVHAATVAHYYNAQTTNVRGTVAYPSPYGGISHYEMRSVSNLVCARLSSVSFRCSYLLSKSYQADRDSLYGKLLVIGMLPTSNNSTYTYTLLKEGWISKDLQDKTYAEAVAYYQNLQGNSNSNADAKRRYEDEERKRRYDQCRYVDRNALCIY